jgi:hypothetical protein
MTRRWIVDTVGDAMFERLANELSASELQSVLLEVMQRRAKARTPAQVLAQYERDLFVRPGMVDQRRAVAIDGHLLAAAARFEALELSPMTPLGTCSTVALTDQHRIVSALRTAELVSDPTNVLALECASRLRASRAPVHLATCHRPVRAQPVPKLPRWSQHFRMFVLASGGIETKDHEFTIETMVMHVRTMLAALARLEDHGYAFGARRLEVLATPERAAVADRIATAITDVPVSRMPLEQAYYFGLRYKLMVTALDGTELFLVDGGAFDWLAKLTSNRRAVYIATGTGSQLMASFERPS